MQGVQVVAPPPQIEPTNPLDMFDPFQNYPVNSPAPLPGVAMPRGNLAHVEALAHHQGGHDREQSGRVDALVHQQGGDVDRGAVDAQGRAASQ